MNQVVLLGRVTRTLELKESESHNKYVKFTLAVDEYWSSEKRTNFIDIVAFGKQAEVLCEYVEKGRKLAITGTLSSEEYVNKEGTKVKRTSVILKEFDFADQPKQNKEVAAAKEQ